MEHRPAAAAVSALLRTAIAVFMFALSVSVAPASAATAADHVVLGADKVAVTRAAGVCDGCWRVRLDGVDEKATTVSRKGTPGSLSAAALRPRMQGRRVALTYTRAGTPQLVRGRVRSWQRGGGTTVLVVRRTAGKIAAHAAAATSSAPLRPTLAVAASGDPSIGSPVASSAVQALNNGETLQLVIMHFVPSGGTGMLLRFGDGTFDYVKLERSRPQQEFNISGPEGTGMPAVLGGGQIWWKGLAAPTLTVQVDLQLIFPAMPLAQPQEINGLVLSFPWWSGS